MVVLGAFAPGSCDIATRCQMVGDRFANEYINIQLEHFENELFFYRFLSPYFTK